MALFQITGGSLDALSAEIGLSIGSLGQAVSSLLLYIFPLAGMVLLLYLIYGGYQVMLSGGDPAKVKAGQQKITSALVGFLIIFAAFWIVQLIGIAFGIQAITNIFV